MNYNESTEYHIIPSQSGNLWGFIVNKITIETFAHEDGEMMLFPDYDQAEDYLAKHNEQNQSQGE